MERHCRDPLRGPFNVASGFTDPVIKIEAYGLLNVLQTDIYKYALSTWILFPRAVTSGLMFGKTHLALLREPLCSLPAKWKSALTLSPPLSISCDLHPKLFSCGKWRDLPLRCRLAITFREQLPYMQFKQPKVLQQYASFDK